MKAIIVAAAILAVANAECPNSCSGHGSCGVNDQCTCYQGFRGNACEQRTCPYGKAWTTTPQGDLNYDGDLNDASVYDGVNAFNSRDHIVRAENLGGTWEYWPSYAKNGEGHFDMECSNAGLCNKDAGECQCFAGFEGYACERMSCPGGNDCNGHGRCMTIAQRMAEEGVTHTYTLWDLDKARSCKCDPGYDGIDCLKRTCPRGDDPLTKTHQTNDIQFIDIYTDDVTEADIIAGLDPAATTAVNLALGGTFTVTYTDSEGESYTTTPVAVVRYDGDTAALDVATDLEDALVGLPNGKIPSVKVTAMYCESLVLGQLLADNSNHAAIAGAGKFLRCPSFTADKDSIFSATSTGTVVADGAASATARNSALTLTAQYGCLTVTYPNCMRLAVEFIDPVNSGKQEMLTVNVDEVKRGNYAKKAFPSTQTNTVVGSVTKQLDFVVADGSSTSTFVQAGTTIMEGNLQAPAGSTDLVFDTFTSGSGTTFPKGSVVQVWCDSTSIGDYIVLGTVTPAAQGADIFFTTNLNDPKLKCVSGNSYKLVLKTNYIETNLKLENSVIASLDIGFAVGVVGTNDVSSTIKEVVPFDEGTELGYLLLSEKELSATIAAAGAFTTLGDGTKESDVCSGRGNCDFETGLCQCFKGYSGERCDTQNALWLGA